MAASPIEGAGVDAAGPTVRERAESRASLAAIAAFAAAAVVIAVWMWGERLPLSGGEQGSLGTRAAWVSGGCAGVAFLVAFLGASRRGEGAWRSELPRLARIVGVVALTASFSAVSALSVHAVAALFQLGFVGMTVDALGGGALGGSAAAFLAYVASVFGARVTTVGIATLATLVVFIGTLASMLTAPDERWWEYHFSALGNQEGRSAAAFNGALILTGLLITTFADYAGRDALAGLTRGGAPSGGYWTGERRAAAVTRMLVAIGLCMMVVGLVHDAMNKAVHVGAASGMVVVFGALAVFALTMLPGLPRSFLVLTLAVMAGVVAAIVLWIPLGYYALTGVEFIAAGLLFAWFMVFARTIAAYARPEE